MSAAMQKRQDALESMMRAAPVVAVVVIGKLGDAIPLARALVAGGIHAIEITLRTPVALDAIRAVAAEVDGAIAGAGTVLTAADLHAAEDAGARFGVSPGTSPALLAALEKSTLPFLPGSATASEALALFERGYRLQKFFPAEPAGGVEYLRAVHGPLPGIGFCPTGGIRAATAANYLALPNVVCVGGSWLSPADLVRAEDWKAITASARAAALLRGR
ncbi:MAG: bifunctional 4-hydroxy-2-oxoglutarate aldolase/2-dehydro-3-deoxy-phosphogluconate aldolase [Rudaea sp.]|nr:bifunctional 4-hydroxy-2-oxoglutarate aldolase/2-dehydro-3-deoxy-phosphogluconate aldolase [Rudaea sp.]